MSGGRYDERVRDLLADAEAQRLLSEADRAAPSLGERRQLTVMFCDVVGSTALARGHDPEIVREVLRSYQAATDEVVRRHGGRIALYIGDGVLVYFGHPVPHEDDARRAVRAGLDLLEALRPVTREVRSRYGIDLAARVAVHTGVVVLADMGSPSTPHRDSIVGETPNLAARLQDVASPGSLVISEATYELVRGWFLVIPLGPQALKGFDRPVPAYEVVEEAPAETRVQAQVDLSPFVGREAELEQLEELWESVGDGGSATVHVSGEAGIGKSRLADVLRRRVQARDGTALVANCSTFHAATSLFPIRRLIERAADIDARHEPRQSLPRLWQALDAVGQAEALPLFADLLGIPPQPWCPPPELDGPKLRDSLLGALADWLTAAAARGPILLVIDDLQWADPTTVEAVGRVVARRVPGLLLLLTARADHRLPWTSVTRIDLDRLSADDLGRMAERLPESRDLTRAQLQQLIERSDGVPLYLEELLRGSALAQGSSGRPSPTIPAGLRDLLLARFATPGVDLHLAQLLAAIGNEVDADLLAAVSDQPAPVLARQLDGLLAAGLIEDASEAGRRRYRFRHHLLAELAYDTQLAPVRRRNHAAIADAIRARGEEVAAADAGPLAHHLELAGRPAEAIDALLVRARSAQAIGANAEATEDLSHALGLLPLVPDRVESARLEIDLRMARALSTATTLGYAAPLAVEDFQRCEALSLEPDLGVGDPAVLTGLWSNYLLQGRLDDADTIARVQVQQLDRRDPLASFFAAGQGYVEFFRGNWATAAERLAAIDVEAHAGAAERWPLPNDPLVTAGAHLAQVRTIRCEVGEARRLVGASIERAASLPFPRGPFSRCYALGMAAATLLLLGDDDAAREATAEQRELAERHGFTFWTVVANLATAIDGVRAGEPHAAAQASATIALVRALGVIVWLPSFLTTLGDALLQQGDSAAALAALAEAEQVAAETGAGYWSPETARLIGEARLGTGDADGIDDLRRSVQLAVTQGATINELRGLTSLCHRLDDSSTHKALAALVDSLPADTALPDLAAARAALADR